MWKDLTMSQRADMMDLYLSKGITSLDDMRSLYDSSISDTAQGTSFSDGGSIHIKPENRGKFTALKERTGHSATWFKEHGTPAQKKMATFALNSRHWKHGYGGHIYDGTTEDSQQMNIPYAGELPNVTVMPRRIANKAWDKVQERWVGDMPTYYAVNPETGKEEMLREIGNGKYSTYDDKHVFDVLEAEAAKKQREQWIKNGGNASDFDKVMLGTLGLGLAPIALPEIAAGVTAASDVVADVVAATPWGQTAIKALNTPFGKTAINTLLAYPGLNNFFSPEGYQKTANAFNEGRYGDAALSAVGDALDLSMAAPWAKDVYTTGKEVGKIVNKGLNIFNSPLTLRPLYTPVIQRSIGSNITTGTNEETAKAVEKGRNTLLDWIRSPFYKARLEDEPLYRFADDVVADAGKMVEEVPIDISKTKLDLDPSGLVNGITKTRPAIQTQLPDGTIIADLNTGLDVSVASDLGKDADETALHELLHYMTANSKGEPISKAGERIVSKGWMNPTETHFDAINILHKNRSKSWQDYIMDQNESLLPQYDSVVRMVMEEPDKAVSFLKQAGRAESDAKSVVQSLRTRYSEWYDIQEQRAYLQQLFHSKIRPNLKNPNDAAEIEEYLSSHPEVLENFPAYKYIQEVRPGSIKDYAKYFSAALGTVPLIIKIPSKDGQKI